MPTGQGGDTFSVQGDVYKGRAGERLGVGSFFPPAQLIVEGSDRVSGGNLLARWQRDLAGGAGVRVQAYFDRTNRDAIHFERDRGTRSTSTSCTTRRSAAATDVSWGAGARVSPSDFTTVYPTLTFAPEDRGHRFVSAFAQDEIAVVGEKACG